MDLEIWLWVLIGVGGIIGGMLYGMKDEKLVLPHMENKYVWNPGFLAEILFGLAGGFVIFIIVPGSFDYKAGGWETIQILALAGVGGYGGRALVERMVSEQIQELEKNVQELRKQDRWDAIVIKLLEQHLDDDADTPLIAKDKLKNAISSASASTKVHVFEKTRQFRKDCLANERNQPLLEQAIPVFESLIEDDRDDKYHRNHAQLAFVLKDKPNPDWKRAEVEFGKAIEIRDSQNEGGFLAYEFNRAVCRIQLGYEPNRIIPDLERSLRGTKTVNWVRRPDPVLAPGLVTWLRENSEQLQDWVEKNQIMVPDVE